MKDTKYIIVETWNGEGYSSEQKAYIKSFKDTAGAYKHCKAVADCFVAEMEDTRTTYLSESNCFSIESDAYEQDGETLYENAGSVSFLEYKGQKGIVIMAMINDFAEIEDQKNLDVWINDLQKEAKTQLHPSIDEDEIEALEKREIDGVYFTGLLEGDTIYFELDPLEELEGAEKLIASIDFTALKEQKTNLTLAIESINVPSNYKDGFQGAIHLIDAIQDYAVDELGMKEDEVFNLPKEN